MRTVDPATKKESHETMSDEAITLAAPRKKKMTLVVMSGDFDKLFGAFIIATGGAAMGMDVTMFFTFWGLRAIKKNVRTGKTLTVIGYTVNDQNAGNNYAVTFVSVATGVINKLAITVTAVTSSKTYDGTTNSSGVPKPALSRASASVSARSPVPSSAKASSRGSIIARPPGAGRSRGCPRLPFRPGGGGHAPLSRLAHDGRAAQRR